MARHEEEDRHSPGCLPTCLQALHVAGVWFNAFSQLALGIIVALLMIAGLWLAH